MDDGDRLLAKARDALERGRLRRAVRHAWTAGFAAARAQDAAGLEQVIELAGRIRERASGRVEQDAQSAIAYCSRCLADLRAGVRPQSLFSLASLLGRRAVKSCPDCAETIRAEARVCRFCGYRFGQGPAER